MKRAILAIALAILLPGAPGSAAADPVKVVASFSVLADMAVRVGGEHVDVKALVGPDEDAHVYEPTPADARALAGAEVVIVNGLGFEGWMDRLVRASGTKARRIVATDRIDAIEVDGHDQGHGHRHEGDGLDPHAWHSVANAKVYVDNIASGLIQAAPRHAAAFAANAASYKAELDRLDAEIRAAFAAVPRERRRVLTSHDAFGYLARDHGIAFLAPVGISTEAEPSAGEVARLIRQIRGEGVRAVFVENVADPRLVEQVAREGGAAVGGKLHSDALSGPDGPAPTYVEMMRRNAGQIARALSAGV